MDMIYFGQNVLPVKDNDRITLPSNVNSALHDHAYLTQGFDRNLLLMSVESFEKYYSHIKNTSLTDPIARLLNRLFLANAVELDIDKNGQIHLPAGLKDYAGISEKIVVVGQGDYFEVWDPASWEEQKKDLNDYQANTDRFVKFNLATA
jgi:MraZ protein